MIEKPSGGEQRGDESAALACAPPERDPLCTMLDKARMMNEFFGDPAVRIGRFQLLEQIGAGGMGDIYAAYDQQLDRKVAIKLVRNAIDSADTSGERLLREAKTLARLSHPNVVHVYEAGTFEQRVFIAMEFIHGQTLRAWLDARDRRRERSYRDAVLRKFIDAGRGLEAAHQADLVHRDFKPDNVLVGDDGRPRVLDFGLARVFAPALTGAPAEHDEDAVSSGRESLADDGPRITPPLRDARALTSGTRVAGTPLYMAPEQLRGLAVDSRSDQFSFCVALYEALYGEHPFPASNLSELRRALERGVVSPPSGKRVPRIVRNALLRGLSRRPADRFPDMGELLRVLEKGPRQRVRRRIAAGLAAAALAASVLLYTNVDRPDPCASATSAFDAQWTESRRQTIRTAFLDIGLPYAEQTWQTVDRHLSEYAASWRQERIHTCERTHVQHNQSEAHLARSVECLDHGQRRFSALLVSLQSLDSESLKSAAEVVERLPDLSHCQDDMALSNSPTPPDGNDAAIVADIRDRLAHAYTLAQFNHLDEAREIAEQQLERIDEIDYPPVRTHALYHLGRIGIQEGTIASIAEGEKKLVEASQLAEATLQPTLRADIFIDYLRTAAMHGELPDAQKRYEQAQAPIVAIGNPGRRRAELLRHLGTAYRGAQDYGQAYQNQRDALSLLQKIHEPSELLLAAHYYEFAKTRRYQREYGDADQEYRKAWEIYQRLLGETHPRAIDVRFDMATLLIDQGKFSAARPVLVEVHLRRRTALGTSHPDVGQVLLELAHVDLRLGELASAYRAATVGRDIYENAFGKPVAADRDHKKMEFAHTRLGTIALRYGQSQAAVDAFDAALKSLILHSGTGRGQLVGIAQLNLAEALIANGEHRQALTTLEIAESNLPSELDRDADTAAFLAGLWGRALFADGRRKSAMARLEEANSLCERFVDNPIAVECADFAWTLVLALDASGRSTTKRTLSLARAALAVYERQGPEVKTDKRAIERWLEQNRAR